MGSSVPNNDAGEQKSRRPKLLWYDKTIAGHMSGIEGVVGCNYKISTLLMNTF